MRDVCSDKHNLVVIQCDYFGESHMQSKSIEPITISSEFLNKQFSKEDIVEISQAHDKWAKMIEISQNRGIASIPAKFKPNESLDDFCEMGLMQALDNITALYYVINILKDNDLNFNRNKIIVYGHSQGAYLSLLCNSLIPGVFDLVIDNSGWMFPQYLKGNRVLIAEMNNLEIDVTFDYLVKKLDLDHEILNLPYLYKQVDNKAQIITYQGVSDSLVPYEEKKSFVQSLNNSYFHLVTNEDVDGSLFKSTYHGLDADFLNMLDYSLSQFNLINETKDLYQQNKLITKRASYEIYYESGIPLLKISTT